MPQWNTDGTRVSNAAVTCRGSVNVRCRALAKVSRVTSSPPSASPSAGLLSIPVQKPSSAIRFDSCASTLSRCAHLRIDVLRGASWTVLPLAIASHAAARSGTRIRHDTPSIAR